MRPPSARRSAGSWRRTDSTWWYTPTPATPAPRTLAAELGGEAVGCDITDVAATADALGPVLAGGAIQVLVHNAGSHEDVPLAGMTEAQWRGVLDVSLTGFYAALRPVILGR